MAPGRRFFISSFFFLLFLFVIVSVNELRFASLLKLGRSAFPHYTARLSNDSSSIASGDALAENSSTSEDLRILIGILTLPDQYPRRHFLRMVYGTQSHMGARVDVKFIFCNLTKEDQKVLVALEIMRYDDIIILNCSENMDNGKTYTYFSSMPELFNTSDGPYPPYHYVMKADDDTYFRLPSLVASLMPLAREDFYYGFVIPCKSMDPFVDYMSGMGYLVSWDIAEWIRTSDIPKNHLEGPEDRVFAEWLRDGHRAKNRYTAKWSMYNYPVPWTGCSHHLWPDTIAVHSLKNQEKWIDTLSYFNHTADLKPSKFYHIP